MFHVSKGFTGIRPVTTRRGAVPTDRDEVQTPGRLGRNCPVCTAWWTTTHLRRRIESYDVFKPEASHGATRNPGQSPATVTQFLPQSAVLA
jgi:hypothetical protein